MVKTIAKLDELLDWVIKAVFWVIKTTKREKKDKNLPRYWEFHLWKQALLVQVLFFQVLFTISIFSLWIAMWVVNPYTKKKQGRIHGYRSRVQVGRGHI